MTLHKIQFGIMWIKDKKNKKISSVHCSTYGVT